MRSSRWLTLIAAFVTTTAVCVTQPAVANADAVSPFELAAGTGYNGYGGLNVWTEQGGVVKVQFIGRSVSVNSGMPGDGTCALRLSGPDDYGATVPLDSFGNGGHTFPPAQNGDYLLEGSCADLANGRSKVTSQPIRITIDGSGTAASPRYSPPEGVEQSLSAYCDEQVAAIGVVGLSAMLVPAAGPLITALTFAAAAFIRGTCILVGDSSTKANQICRTVQDTVVGVAEAATKTAPLGLAVPSFCGAA